MTPFDKLKKTCRKACREREACAKGYKQMLESENVSQMMATWRDNWDDVVNSKFADIIAKELPKQYPNLKTEMNEAGIYLNECPRSARHFVLVIVTDTDVEVPVYGNANAYILGRAKVLAYDHTHVYNKRAAEAEVVLLDHSYGGIEAGTVTAQGFSHLATAATATLNGHVECHATGGKVYARHYRRIDASGDTVVYATNGRSIYLLENAKLEPIMFSDHEQ